MGVRSRLLIAFLGISALAIGVAAAALISFSSVGLVLERITKTHVPAVITTIEISRQAERIVAAAPTLLAAETKGDRGIASKSIFQQLDQLNKTLDALRDQNDGSLAAQTLAPVVDQLAENLLELDRTVAFRLDVAEKKQALLDQLSDVDQAIQQVLAPTTMVLDAKFASLYRQAGADDKTPQEREKILQELTELVAVTLPLQTAQSEAAAINDMLVFSALATVKSDIDALAFPLRRSHQSFDRILNRVEDRNREQLTLQSGRLSGLIAGDGSLPKTRIRELDLTAQGRALVARNGELSADLTQLVNGLVAQADTQITASGQDAQRAQNIGSLVILIVSGLGLLTSGFVIWVYVSGNLLARITDLSDSMTAIAKGNLHAPLPPTSDTDEIAQMASALKVFRDTAVEVQKTNLVEIRTARQRLQGAISSLSQGFALFDHSDALLICNARYREIMLGDPAPLPEGTRFEKIAAEAANSGRFLGAIEDQGRWRRNVITKFRSGADTSNERFDSDQWTQFTIRTAPEVGTVVVLSDITELKRISDELGLAKDAAEAANDAKSTFLASMSHEVRTPLNGIMGMSALLNGTKLNAEQRDFAATIDEAAQTLLTIINDILDFSKVEAGAMDLETAPIDLIETIEGAVELLSPKASAQGIELACRISQSVPLSIASDSVRLKQILLNLLTNAIKFTDDGEVELSVDTFEHDSGAEWLRIAVRDTGIGIPQDRMDRLFKSFSQVDTSTTRRFGGTGLGLVITQRLVGLMGGTIEVSSTPDVGSVFVIKLPFERSVAPSARHDGQLLELIKNSRVLIVDDNQTNLTILAERLLGWDLVPELADHPDMAVELLRAGHRFDAIITDFKMPGRTGLHMAADIADEFAQDAPPMILYSSVSLLDPDMRAKFDAAGFKAHLMKPAKTQQLLSALVKVIRPDSDVLELPVPTPQMDWMAQRDALDVLLVDDNEINRKIGSKVLKRLGLDPVVVESGADALDACAARFFDVVFMDIEMPDMDGVSATALLRAQLGDAHHPYIVALTANAMVSDRESYLQSGMDDYLSKPIDIQKLTDCLARAQAHRETAPDGAALEVEQLP